MTSDEFLAMRDQLRHLLDRHCPPARVRRILEGEDQFDRALWRELAEAGWLGVTLPEAYGGLGLEASGAALLAEELGRVLAPVPFLSSITLAAEAIWRFGSEAQRTHWLPRLIDGSVVSTLAVAEGPGPLDPMMVAAKMRDGRVSGVKTPVTDGLAADLAVVAAVDEELGVGLYLVDLSADGVTRAAVSSFDPARPLARIDLDHVACDALSAGADDIRLLLDRAAILTAFEQIGGAEAALDMALDYSKIRFAYGRAIGSYQAIKHKLAQVKIGTVMARSSAEGGLGFIDGDDRVALGLAAAAARIMGGKASEEAAREMAQTHGGIAMTHDHDAQLYFRRARHLATVLGTLDQWRWRAAGYLLADDHAISLTAPSTAGGDLAFRLEVRDWLAQHAPAFEMSADGDQHSDAALDLARRWHICKQAAGYVGIGLPVAMGGKGSPAQLAIFKEEEGRYHLPPPAFFLGEGVIVPVLMATGTPAQVEHFAGPAIRGEDIWCEAFSEPSAGSDIAALRTKAQRDGDDWIVTGQKVWTSYGKWSDWAMLLTRTDPDLPKHQGMTMFLLDLRTAGVDIRPLRTMSGNSEFNEIFLNDVRIPDAMRLGKIGDGWKLFNITLLTERLAVQSSPAVNRNVIAPMIDVARRTPGPDGRLLIEDGSFRRDLGDYFALVDAVRHFQAAQLDALCKGTPPSPDAVIGKVAMARPMQRMAAYVMDMRGAAGNVVDPQDPALAEALESFYWGSIYRIAGGSDEVMLNLIAEQILQMPRDVRPDKDVPFSRIAANGEVRA